MQYANKSILKIIVMNVPTDSCNAKWTYFKIELEWHARHRSDINLWVMWKKREEKNVVGESKREREAILFAFWTSQMPATEFRIKICQYSIDGLWMKEKDRGRVTERVKPGKIVLYCIWTFQNNFFVSSVWRFYLLSIFQRHHMWQGKKKSCAMEKWKACMREICLLLDMQSTWKLLSKCFHQFLIFVLAYCERAKIGFIKALWQKSCGDKTNNKAFFLTTYAICSLVFLHKNIYKYSLFLTLKKMCNQNSNIVSGFFFDPQFDTNTRKIFGKNEENSVHFNVWS